MADSRGRVALTPSPPVREAVERIHALTGRKRTTIYADMLDAVAPAFAEQVELLQRIQNNPERAADMVREFGVQGINTISQQLLDLPPPRKRGRPRKHAAP